MVPTTTAITANDAKIAYTAYPPAKSYSTEYAKREVAPAGPTARATDAIVCASPLVAPSERLFGAEEFTNMNMQAAPRSKEYRQVRGKRRPRVLLRRTVRLDQGTSAFGGI